MRMLDKIRQFPRIEWKSILDAPYNKIVYVLVDDGCGHFYTELAWKNEFGEWVNIPHYHSVRQWADNNPVNVWHEASEMPKEGEWILIQCDEDSYDTLVLCDMDADTFCAWCKKYDVSRWAYISDLLPEGGEK